MAHFPSKSHFALFYISLLLQVIGVSRGQVRWEKPDTLEQTFPMNLNYVYSDRHGRILVSNTSGTALVTNNGTRISVSQFPVLSPATVQPDGGVVGRRDPTRVVSRYLPSGVIDTSFVAPQVNSGDTDGLTSIAAQPDGKLIVACGPLLSGVSPFEGINHGLFRLNSDGSFDPTFKMSGGPMVQLSVLPDGRFYALGGGSLYRFLPDGTVDSTFRPAQLGSFSGPVDYDFQPDGKIIVVGSFYTANGSISPNIARFNASGGFDFTFAREPNGFGGLEGVRVQSDGSVLIQNGSRVGKLRPDGTLDRSFPAIDTTNRLGGIGIDPSDRLYFDDGENSFFVYSGRLRVTSLPTIIPTMFEQTSSLSGPWTSINAVAPNATVDYRLPNPPGPGNAFFRLRPTQ